MPCTDINNMLDELGNRQVDQRKIIANVHGANQAGSSLWIKGLNEKLWMSDALFIGQCGFLSLDTHEPSTDPIEIRIHPPFIPSGVYQNVSRSPHNGDGITRGPSDMPIREGK